MTEELKRSTARIQALEQNWKDSEQMVAAGRMAATVAHEINNPLAGIKNAFALVKDCIAESHLHYKYVSLIDKEINRIAFIVQHLFAIYRPGGQAAHEFCIQDVVGDLVTLLETSFRCHGVQPATDLPQAPLVVTLPEMALREVLVNLVVNAVEASPFGAAVTISAAVIEDRLTITVADQGSGIPESLRPVVFDPFVTTKNEPGKGGLGLGLTISRDLTRAMGGTLEFECLRNQGTVFTMKLPLRCP